ncbi:hypothetical protein Tco_1381962 [Tanacetum coccineum]
MDQKTNDGRLSLGEDNQESMDVINKGKDQWTGPEYHDTAESAKKSSKLLFFYRMEENEERYSAPCHVGGLHAYDGEINLAYEKNMLSNEYAVKMCLDIEEIDGEKVVRREMLVTLKGEFYFVKFIINPEEDDTEPCVILGRSFLKLAKGVVDFGNGIITMQPDPDFFGDDSDEEEEHEWESIFDLEEIKEPTPTEPRPYVCNMGKSTRNKRRALGGFQTSYPDEGPSWSNGTPLTQEEMVRQDLVRSICEKRLLEEMGNEQDKLKGIIDRKKETIDEVIGEVLKEREDPGAFIIPIRIDARVNLSVLIDTASEVNMIPYPVYQKLDVNCISLVGQSNKRKA